MEIVDNDFDPAFADLKGKKVALKCKGEICIGTLNFAGINNLSHGEYQVTLGRTPHWPVDPMTIRLYEEKPRIHDK